MSKLAEHQAEMEQSIRDFVAFLNKENPGGVCQLLAPEFVSCDYASRTLVLKYVVHEWMRNPGGVMHGGAVASAIDTTMGSQTFFWAGDQMTPTINLLCNFVRPVPLGCSLYIRSHITYVGRSMLYVSAEAWSGKESEPLITAQGVYHVPGAKTPRRFDTEAVETETPQP